VSASTPSAVAASSRSSASAETPSSVVRHPSTDVSERSVSQSRSSTSPEAIPRDPFEDLFNDAAAFQGGSEAVMKDTSINTSLVTELQLGFPRTAIPIATEDSSGDSYFNFFLTELSKSFPYVNLFPWTAATLFSTSSLNPALRQSVLAVAALFASQQEETRQGTSFAHLHSALQLIRSRLSETGADNGLAISTFLLAQYAIMRGEVSVARHHLRGMAKILLKLDQTSESAPSPITSDPLTILIWRMAIRVDFISSIATGEAPVLAEYASPPTMSLMDWSAHRTRRNPSMVDPSVCRYELRHQQC
jgi:hypothetical protein